MFWTEKIFNTIHPIIGMCHLQPLPNDPFYDETKGINFIIEKAVNDIEILQKYGYNGILFSNEFSFPYSQKISQVTVATMARVIGELKKQINIPFGIDCMYDAYSTMDLAIATDADFYRITLVKATLYDYEFGITQLGSLLRYANQNRIKKSKSIININSSIESSIINKNVEQIIKTITLQSKPDSLCISAATINKLFSIDYNINPKTFENIVLICDGGCDENNVKNIINHSNGIIIGTALKEDNILTNPISSIYASKFMNIVNNINI